MDTFSGGPATGKDWRKRQRTIQTGHMYVNWRLALLPREVKRVSTCIERGDIHVGTNTKVVGVHGAAAKSSVTGSVQIVQIILIFPHHSCAKRSRWE